MNSKLDGMYLAWLYSLIELMVGRSYWKLMELMFRTKFEWFVDHDGNRAGDGMSLRRDFIMAVDPPGVTDEWLEIDCSFLEMLIALSDRMALQLDMPVSDCFWRILKNIGLDMMHDENFDEVVVEEKLETIMNRTYQENGAGGLFPLRNAGRDQRHVELIYQMYAYIMEIYR